MNESQPSVEICPTCGNAMDPSLDYCVYCATSEEAPLEDVVKIRDDIEKFDQAINYRKYQLECEERKRQEKIQKAEEELQRARDDRIDLVKRYHKPFSPVRPVLRHKMKYSEVTEGMSYSLWKLVLAFVLNFLPPGFIVSDILLRKEQNRERYHWMETGERFNRPVLIILDVVFRYFWYGVLILVLAFFAMEGAGLWSPLQLIDRYLPAIIRRLPF